MDENQNIPKRLGDTFELTFPAIAGAVAYEVYASCSFAALDCLVAVVDAELKHG